MVLLEPEKFLAELEKCLNASKAKKRGSVFFTMKRYDGRTKPKPRDAAAAPEASAAHKCLVRVTYGNRKLSSHISQTELNKFQIAFSALMRHGLSNIGKAAVAPGQAQPPAESSSAGTVNKSPAVSASTSTAAAVKPTKSLPAPVPAVAAATARKKGKAV
ncbi:putative Signal recognition particle 14 kDa protein [Hypsibius exemplaris]|uniref:Signal recognition particle 14 kDa protein n=1 Tax=Hypsibius exemplaris TaxID=2072580 RepID=A0A1W0X4V3_HYPEX|nr:putative Signal recognition particle 14 kDa protein [Hypsibius exemplaris]